VAADDIAPYVGEALKAIRVTAWELDAVTGALSTVGPDDRILSPSTDTTTLLGLVHPDDRPVLEARLRELITEGREEGSARYRIRTDAGEWRWFETLCRTVDRDGHGRARRVIGVTIDRSANDELEAEVRRTATRLRSYVSSSLDAVWCFEPVVPIPVTLPADEQYERLLDAVLVECSDRYAAMRHTTPAALLGRRMGDLLGVRLEMLRGLFARMAATGYALTAEPLELAAPDGTVRNVIASVTGVVEAGRLVCVWGTFADVTARMQAERERAALEAQLQQALRLESLGALAGGVAHDFNNLLVAIGGNAQYLLDTTKDAPTREALVDIHDAARRASQLTQKLLTFSREQPTQRLPFEAASVVGGIGPILRRLLPVTMRVDIDVAAELPVLVGDATAIEQALVNLAVNARDACRGEGTLKISVAAVSLGEEECRGKPWARPGHYVRIAMEDDGPGIAPEHLPRVFEPFFTTKPLGEGTGLGLALVYGTIVRQHRGLLEVQSELGRGARFAAYLPCEGEAAEGGPAERPLTPPVSARGTLLLAEDEAAVRRVAVRVLEREGYTVHAVADGLEAVAAYEASPDRFSLVILDAVMPRMGGRGVFDRVVAIRPEQRVLFVSGYASGTIDETLIDRTRRWFLPKPWSTEALLAAVHHAIES
jgi:signal transduction histidine kinase